MRRVFLFIILLVLVGGAVWYFFLRTKTDENGNPVAATGFQSFFPLGGTGSDSGPDGVVPTGTETPGSPTNVSRFTQVTDRAIAGYTVFTLTKTVTLPNPDPKLPPIITTVTDHYLRYVARASGYVYEIKNAEPAVQISNIFIPNIYEATFADSNTTALLRFLRPDSQTIGTYSVPIPPINTDGTRTQIAGTFLSDNIDSLVVSPDTKLLARLTTDQNGALVSTTTTRGATKKDLIRSPFREWLISWPTQNTLYVQTKAASTANGFLYRIDSAAGRLRRVIGDIPGLTTSISQNGASILYSQSTQNGFVTRLFDTKTGVTTNLSLAILPEKCVWYVNNDLLCAGSNTVPEGVYPDSWYAGLTHFQDQLYRINPATNTYSVVYDGTERLFDMTDLKLDEGQNLLYFIDKSSGTLWKTTL